MRNKNFVMPSLGADMEEGKFVHWLVKPGDAVKRGQVVCVVETRKGAIDVEIWDAGTMTELVAKPGDVIDVGGTLGIVQVEGEATAVQSAKPAVQAASAAKAVGVGQVASGAAAAQHVEPGQPMLGQTARAASPTLLACW